MITLSDDILNHVLSQQLTPIQVRELHQSNPILYKKCIVSFLQEWMKSGSFWDFAKQFHPPHKRDSHEFLAYQMYNTKKQQFEDPLPWPTFTNVREEWYKYYQLGQGLWSEKDQQVWQEWLQFCAYQYPSEKFQTCPRCRYIIPQEDMQRDNLCIFCYNYENK